MPFLCGKVTQVFLTLRFVCITAVIGIIILLAQFAYLKGYEYGTYLGNNLTEIVEENRAESIK